MSAPNIGVEQDAASPAIFVFVDDIVTPSLSALDSEQTDAPQSETQILCLLNVSF
jgi:hypothetical protein